MKIDYRNEVTKEERLTQVNKVSVNLRPNIPYR